MIKTYKKLATIQAEQFDNSREMAEKYHVEYDGAYILPFRIETPDGWLGMKIGDWIVTGVNGNHRPIADDIFKKTYEEVKQLHKVLDNMIEPAKCKYCDMNEHNSIGYSSSSEVFPGTYESANIIKTNDDIGKSQYLSDEKAEPNKYYLIVEGDGMGITEIHYCPVCGRSLNK